MSRSMLCRTCKRPSAGEHQSWCSHSANNHAIERAVAFRIVEAMKLPTMCSTNEPVPCPGCGYQACMSDEACPKFKPRAEFVRPSTAAIKRMMDTSLRRLEYFALWGRYPDGPFETAEDVRRELAKEEARCARPDDYATHAALSASFEHRADVAEALIGQELVTPAQVLQFLEGGPLYFAPPDSDDAL
jgi:hypothetical protein